MHWSSVSLRNTSLRFKPRYRKLTSMPNVSMFLHNSSVLQWCQPYDGCSRSYLQDCLQFCGSLFQSVCGSSGKSHRNIKSSVRELSHKPYPGIRFLINSQFRAGWGGRGVYSRHPKRGITNFELNCHDTFENWATHVLLPTLTATNPPPPASLALGMYLVCLPWVPFLCGACLPRFLPPLTFVRTATCEVDSDTILRVLRPSRRWCFKSRSSEMWRRVVFRRSILPPSSGWTLHGVTSQNTSTRNVTVNLEIVLHINRHVSGVSLYFVSCKTHSLRKGSFWQLYMYQGGRIRTPLVMDWIHLAQDRVHGRAVVNTTINLRFP
jgi:hypothetical protein